MIALPRRTERDETPKQPSLDSFGQWMVRITASCEKCSAALKKLSDVLADTDWEAYWRARFSEELEREDPLYGEFREDGWLGDADDWKDEGGQET